MNKHKIKITEKFLDDESFNKLHPISDANVVSISNENIRVF